MYYILMQTATGQQQPNPLVSFLPFVFLIFILYFLIIRPQQKKQKEHQKMLDEIKIHDTVITTGGIVGKIVNIKKDRDTVILKVDDNTKIEVRRIAIAGVWNEPGKSETANKD